MCGHYKYFFMGIAIVCCFLLCFRTHSKGSKLIFKGIKHLLMSAFSCDIFGRLAVFLRKIKDNCIMYSFSKLSLKCLIYCSVFAQQKTGPLFEMSSFYLKRLLQLSVDIIALHMHLPLRYVLSQKKIIWFHKT